MWLDWTMSWQLYLLACWDFKETLWWSFGRLHWTCCIVSLAENMCAFVLKITGHLLACTIHFFHPRVLTKVFLKKLGRVLTWSMLCRKESFFLLFFSVTFTDMIRLGKVLLAESPGQPCNISSQLELKLHCPRENYNIKNNLGYVLCLKHIQLKMCLKFWICMQAVVDVGLFVF